MRRFTEMAKIEHQIRDKLQCSCHANRTCLSNYYQADTACQSKKVSGARTGYDIELVAGDPRITAATDGAAQRITLERPRDGGWCEPWGYFGKRDRLTGVAGGG